MSLENLDSLEQAALVLAEKYGYDVEYNDERTYSGGLAYRYITIRPHIEITLNNEQYTEWQKGRS